MRKPTGIKLPAVVAGDGLVGRLWRNQRLRFGAYLGVWLVVFLIGARPVWQASYLNEKKIAATSARLEALTSMAAAGAWFNAAAADWQPVQEREYERRFPREKDREQLFLELAQVARAAGIDPFNLREIPISVESGGEDPVDELAMGDDEADLASLEQQFAADPSNLPGTELQTYRLAAGFDADFGRMARFLAGLRSVPRAVNVHTLTATPGAAGINVSMELDFYVQSAR